MLTIQGVGPTRDTFNFNTGHSASGRMTAVALGGTDGSRMYAGSFAGVWRSDDGGRTWFQLTWPQPPFGTVQGDFPGALYVQEIYDVAASPADPDVVLVSGLKSLFGDGRDGIYRSVDGGKSWTLTRKNGFPCNIVFAPDDANLVYAATGSAVLISRDGGAHWLPPAPTSPPAWHVAVGPLEASGIRRVYAAGDSSIWFSADGGTTWNFDGGGATINNSRAALESLRVQCSLPKPDPEPIGGFAGSIDVKFAGGAGANVLAIEPGNTSRVYLAAEGAANGPRFYKKGVDDGTLVNDVQNTRCDNFAGEGSLWVGDFGQFTPGNPAAQWTQLPGPPVYFGTTTPSGVVFVKAKQTSSGFLLFFSDSSHIHVSAGTPANTSSWHRIDGEDLSVANRAGHHSNVVFMHPDPHGLVFTSNFEITLKPASGVAPPFNSNSELDQFISGTLWTANDGGVNWTEDGGRNATSWNWPRGLETIDPVNIAGLFGLGSKPALYFGCGDNHDFFTRNGGQTWQDPGSSCGDCDAWFSDVADASRVILFLPNQGPGVLGIVKSGDSSHYPDASVNKIFPPSTRTASNKPYASSGAVLNGLRPVVKTLATESPLPDGDYVLIDQDQTSGALSLKRTIAISSISAVADWNDPNKAGVVGPNLPAGTLVVQPSGGHFSTAFFVGDGGGNVFRLNAAKTNWDQIVPAKPVTGTQVKAALMWFVDPYDPNVIYVLDSNGMKVSADGGKNWFFDAGMTNVITAGGKLSIQAALLSDMQFSRGERQTRFAVGAAGVACTMDFGITWFPILNSIALPGRPESGFFDPISDLSDRAFYVECLGRSVLRIGGLPALPPFQPPPVFDLMEFAALDY